MTFEAVTESLGTLLGRLAGQLYAQTGKKSEKRELEPVLETLNHITKIALYDQKNPNKNVFLGEVAIKPDDDLDLVVKEITDNFKWGFLGRRGLKLSTNPQIRDEETRKQIELNYPYIGDPYELEDFMKKVIDCSRAGGSKYRFVLPNLYIQISRRQGLEEVVPQLVFTDYIMSIFATMNYFIGNTIELKAILYFDTNNTILRHRENYKKNKYDPGRIKNFLDIAHELNAMIIKERRPG